MGVDIRRLFADIDLVKVGQGAKQIMDLTLRTDKRSGMQIARAVLEDGTTLIKTVTKTGVVSEIKHTIPPITSTLQRNAVIKDLYKNKLTQEMIAKMLGISQGTVSNVLRKK